MWGEGSAGDLGRVVKRVHLDSGIVPVLTGWATLFTSSNFWFFLSNMGITAVPT